MIETGVDGNVVLTRSGDSITVFPNSKMAVPVSDNGGDPGVLQSLGKLLFRMESRESRDFKIDTPYLAAAIKGTTFTVEVDDDDAAVEVSEGSVLVTANRSGQSAYVGAGERAEVGGDRGDAVQVSDVGDTDGEGGRVSKTNLDKLDGRSKDDTKEATTSSLEGGMEGSLEGGTTGKDSPTDPDNGMGNDDK